MIKVYDGESGQVVLFADIAYYGEEAEDFKTFEASFLSLVDQRLACWVYVGGDGLQEAVNLSHCSSWVTAESSLKARMFAEMVNEFINPRPVWSSDPDDPMYAEWSEAPTDKDDDGIAPF